MLFKVVELFGLDGLAKIEAETPNVETRLDLLELRHGSTIDAAKGRFS
jgi:hypothetical protein